MTGKVSDELEAVVWVKVPAPDGTTRSIEAVVDTGFNGYLTLPRALIDEFRFEAAGQTLATLGDGTEIRLPRHLGTILWLGAAREAVILEAEGGPLLGMSLLLGSRIQLDVVPGGQVTIDPR